MNPYKYLVSCFLMLMLSDAYGGATWSVKTVDTPARSGGCTGSYTISLNVASSAFNDMANGAAVSITFNSSAGMNATTCTGGTYKGSAIGAMTLTATTISFNAPVAAVSGTTFAIVLNGITHGTSIAAGNITVSVVTGVFGSNTGTTNNYTTGVSGVPTATAGADQIICSGTTATMAGNVPGAGTGTWTWISGTGTGTITSANSATSTITGLVAGENTYRWTVVNGSCSNSDNVVISLGLSANAGADQTVCTSTATMSATAPLAGTTGVWTLAGGAGTITTPSSATSGLTALGTGANTFTWTVSKAGCADATDNVIINNPVCAQLNLKAPSFDTTASTAGGWVVHPWTSCGTCCSGGSCTTAPTPDTQYSIIAPSNGNSYIGMGSTSWGGSDATEAVSQELITPMVAGTTYQLTIDLAYYSAAGFYDVTGIEFRIMGGFSCCEYSEQLYSTSVTTTTWSTKTIIFTPAYNNTHIMLRAKDNTATSDTKWNYVLVDNMTNINTSGTAKPRCTATSKNQCVAALPVEFAEYKAECKNGKMLLSWITASETNNDFFTIERTMDGITYDAIGIVDSKAPGGNSTQTLNYNFVDHSFPQEEAANLNQLFYYRLRQTDFDGNYAYSPIQAASCSSYCMSDITIAGENNELFLTIPSICSTFADFSIYNALGQIVFTKREYIETGNNVIRFNADDMAAGLYIVKASTRNQTFQKKFAKP